MERIKAKQVQSMMEAYVSVYEKKGEDCVPKSEKGDHNCAKKVCHEEFGQGETIFGQHAEPDENGFVSHYDVQFEHGIVENVSVEDLEVLTMEGHGGHKKKTMYAHTEIEGEELQENQAANRARQRELRQQQNAGRAEQQFGGLRPQPRTIGNDRRFNRRSASPSAQANTNRVGQNIKVGPITGPNQLRKPSPQVMANKPAQSPTSNLKPGDPSTVVSPKSGEETKFERRLPTSAELRAAQARRANAPAGESKQETEYQAVKAGVGVSKGTVKDPKIAADAARKARLDAIRAKAKADTMSRMGGRNRARMEEVDIFDTIKEYLIGEGATEEEALKQMLTLTDEQRTEIIEGSCGSKPKKKGGKK